MIKKDMAVMKGNLTTMEFGEKPHSNDNIKNEAKTEV